MLSVPFYFLKGFFCRFVAAVEKVPTCNVDHDACQQGSKKRRTARTVCAARTQGPLHVEPGRTNDIFPSKDQSPDKRPMSRAQHRRCKDAVITCALKNEHKLLSASICAILAMHSQRL
jgi:hypothetical protein